MPNRYFLPVVHPSFELLKKSAPVLHFIGASIILLNGLDVFYAHSAGRLAGYLQLFIAAELYFVLFFARPLLVQSPGFNIFFRSIETLGIIGSGFLWLINQHTLAGMLHLVLGFGYAFLLYREWRIMHSESVDISHTGISVPNFIKDEEIPWPEIRSIIPGYHSIFIETLRNRKIRFQLSKNLKIEELQQIDEFCREHLNG